MANAYRGRGEHAYRRQRDALAARCRANKIGCTNCGHQFDWDNPNSARGFTADHPHPVNAGGRLLGQQLVPMCRACNARKGATVAPILRPAT